MDYDDDENSRFVTASTEDHSQTAVNSLILDYYKKFGRKRDLEQYFSLSTAQGDLKDPSGSFWSRMKSENDSSDSGEKKSDSGPSSQEVCRISIRCSAPDPCTSQEEDSKTKTESVSPPIIIEELPHNSHHASDVESIKSDDNNSQKSYDVMLDTSTNKPLSPSSSITSQRKLEWDSLADVGYANETDRKTSASSLSTLERLALIQQYSNNDNQSKLGVPTAHSTPLDENEPKRGKKGIGKKSTKIYKKDVDLVEVNMPHMDQVSQSINVNLTKHISFNVEKDGKVTVDNIQKDVSISPEKVLVDTGVSPRVKMDSKEIQTSLVKTKEANLSPVTTQRSIHTQKIPILISLNTLRKRTRRKNLRMARKKLKSKKKTKDIPQDKSVEQLSEAESFEYMPGHIYNQNQLQAEQRQQTGRPTNTAGNKSSLESSGILTTDSSKGSKHSFTRDLEKSIELLRNALQERCDDSKLRKQLIKQVCERLLKSKYRDDDSTSDFLSGLSFSSKKLGLGDRNQTTSTSEANDSGDQLKRPKKSILRNEKFNSSAIASTSQSAPNLPVATISEKPVSSKLTKPHLSSNTDSEFSSKEKTSSDNVFAKPSSEELYQKYLDALKREDAYKRHLKDKEVFLKQKLVNSDSAFTVPARAESKVNNRLKDLIQDLTRNNYDDGSGDASKLEGGLNTNVDFNRYAPIKTQRSHSVFTLSSGNSDYQKKKSNLKKRLQSNIKDLAKPGPSKEHYCCCPHHAGNSQLGVTDSSVQVNIKIPCCADLSNDPKSPNTSPRLDTQESPRNSKIAPNNVPGDIKYVCLCNKKPLKDVPDNFLVYKCSRLKDGDSECTKTSRTSSPRTSLCSDKNLNMPSTSKCYSNPSYNESRKNSNDTNFKKSCKSSQTNLLLKMLRRKSSDRSIPCDKNGDIICVNDKIESSPTLSKVYEATRIVQTEISIDPRISEPTLSDINIVSDANCANLISESCRDVSKPKLTDVESRENETKYTGSLKSTGTSISNSESKGDSTEISNYDFEQKCKKNSDFSSEDSKIKSDERTENFKIPIQGTNMTLLVSFGGSKPKSVEINEKDSVKLVSQNVGTDNCEMNEQATSLTEECSKGVQCRKTGIESGKVDLNSNNSCNVNQNTETTSEPIESTNNLKTHLTDEPKILNTYPKSPVNERKPFLRTNTDTDRLVLTSEQTDFFESYMKSQNTKCSANNSSFKNCELPKPESGEKCSCGCSKNKKECGNDCSKRKTSTGCAQVAKSDLVQLKENEKCSCGCSKNEADCGDNCSKRKSVTTPKDLHGGHEVVKPLEICTCGCSKNQDDCGDSCSKRKTPAATSKNKNSGQEKVKEIEKCSCGCNNNVDDCGDNCSKHKQSVGAVKDENHEAVQSKEVDKCSCGCSKNIYECGNKCANAKTSLATSKLEIDKDKMKCKCGCGGNKRDCKLHCIENDKIPLSLRSTKTKEVAVQKDLSDSEKSYQSVKKTEHGCSSRPQLIKPCIDNENTKSIKRTGGVNIEHINTIDSNNKGMNSSQSCSKGSDKKSEKGQSETESEQSNYDPILNMIQDITKRYTKKDLEKSKRKKCFKEIMNVLHYLLETEDSSDRNDDCRSEINCTPLDIEPISPPTKDCQEKLMSEKPKPELVDKEVQYSLKKSKERRCVESSEVPVSTDIPGTSSDSATCKVLNKIKKECEKYHQKRCKIHSGKKCDASSTTSVNCDQCRRIHYCACRTHKCKIHKKCTDKKTTQCGKTPVAYNLILQTSDSLMSEERPCRTKELRNIVIKVPPKKKSLQNLPFKELESKIECRMTQNKHFTRPCRSRSMPNESEISSFDEIIRRTEPCTVREYLEKNRPDFVDNCSQRQNCMKYVNGSRNEDRPSKLKMVVVHTPECFGKTYYGHSFDHNCVRTNCVPNSCYDPCANNEVTRIANERAVKRDLLSMRVAQVSNVNELDSDELRQLAKELRRHIKQRKTPQKIISERDMKKHSEKIYKSLPEVVQKKEEIKKENEKKTNLLMASIFKKNLQKKTLQGAVNLSNYSTIIKI